MLKIYNTLSRKKVIFQPLIPNQVSLYVCGMTVYDHCHLGHARTLVAFDVMVRYLKFLGYDVRYVRNITDVDDKIINRAVALHEEVAIFSERYIQALHKECTCLKLLPPTVEPRATDNMNNIVQLIKKLYDTGFAYVGENGDVYYHVNQFQAYGRLAHRDLDGMISGARVEVSESKKNPLDFVLWKLAKPGEPSWSSPWGQGRPGWHIECSAMAMTTLGTRIDIHGGGSDLIFPHHENEIAQTEAITHEPLANYWVHVGMLQINKEKMSKSLGNAFTINAVLKQYHPEVVRYFLMANHYRSPLQYDENSLPAAHQALQRLYIALRGLSLESVDKLPLQIDENVYLRPFSEAMEDDFNTPEALAVLFELAKEINRRKENELKVASELGRALIRLGHLLGILQEDPQSFLSNMNSEILESEVSALIEKRNEARRNKNWELADQIRQELISRKITLEDTSKGTIWRSL